MGSVVKIEHKSYEFVLGDLKFTFPMFCQPIVPERTSVIKMTLDKSRNQKFFSVFRKKVTFPVKEFKPKSENSSAF